MRAFYRSFAKSPLRARQKISINSWSEPGDPSVYGRIDLDCKEVLAFLERLNQGSDVKVTVTHVVCHVLAGAIARCPELNGIIVGKRLYLRKTIDISALVAIDGGKDLSAAKLPRADTMTVQDIARRLLSKSSELRRGEDRELQRTQSTMARLPSRGVGWLMRGLDFVLYRLGFSLEWAGVPYDQFGSAIVTSVGMLGIDMAYVPLVPVTRVPLFVLVGTVQPRPAVVDGQVVARPMLTLGCTFDHRFMDGSQAAVLAQHVREVFADPERLLKPPREDGHTA